MFAVEGWVTGLDNVEWLFRVSASWPSCARWLHQGCWPHCRGKKRALCNRETLRFGRQFKRQTHWCISHFEWFDNAAQQRVGTWALVRLTNLTAFDDGPSGGPYLLEWLWQSWKAQKIHWVIDKQVRGDDKWRKEKWTFGCRCNLWSPPEAMATNPNRLSQESQNMIRRRSTKIWE